MRISPTIDIRTGTFRATLLIPNEKGDLAPGMFGNFTVAYEEHSDALLIPAAALLDEDSEAAVYVVSEGEVVRRVVETGVEAGGKIEVLGGLTENDRIVVTGQGGLRDGSKVLARNVSKDSFSG
jgi:RND family efflux transporter MFP subunit